MVAAGEMQKPEAHPFFGPAQHEQHIGLISPAPNRHQIPSAVLKEAQGNDLLQKLRVKN